MLYDLFAHYLEKDTNHGLNELLNFLPYILVRGPFAQHFSAGILSMIISLYTFILNLLYR